MNLKVIEHLALNYSIARNDLAALVNDLNERLETVKAKFITDIRANAAIAAQLRRSLESAVEDNPGLFQSPRTQVFHGIKIGLRKGAGVIEWDDDETTCQRIEKHFPKSQAELLIKSERWPIKKALADLDVKDLRAIGCTIEEAGDKVVVKPVDGEIEKLVAVLLDTSEDRPAAKEMEAA